MSQELFLKALEIVQSRTKKAIFETWFSRLEFLSIAEDVITIGTPNHFIKEWIEESGDMVPVLALAIRDAFGQSLTPSLVIIERDEEKLEESGLIVRPDSLLLAPPSEPDPEPRMRPPSTAIFRNTLHEVSIDDWSVPLKEDYVFEHFVVGPSNRLSHAAALAVAQNPGQAYNPLFIHSASGLGKTHLLQAVCSVLLSQAPPPSILYLSCEDFVNQFIEAVKDGHLENFRFRYRKLDMLLIDDIHFLADKPRIQEEFFHTFNTLYNAQKQIVLSADCHPSEIPTLNERLVSRFKWGLVSRIDPPEFETRAAIIKKKSDQKNASLDGEVVNLMAARITSNIREIEGALNRLIGTSRLLNRSIDKNFVIEELSDLLGEASVSVAMDDIIEAVTARYEVKLSDLRSKKRTKKIAFPRQICMYLARDLTELTLQEIGEYFGGRDHTTVLYAIEKITKSVSKDMEINDSVRELSRDARQRALNAAHL